MACFGPLTGYFGKAVNPATGKRAIVFSPLLSYDGLRVKLPCGQCVGCRLEKARQWAMRCMHEKLFHEDSCFVTLTYRDEELPDHGTLVKPHPSAFCKRLHNRLLRSRRKGIRYYLCGEYGETTFRPHYHVLIFGYSFPDQVRYAENARGDPVYTSKECDEVWGLGECKIGTVTFDSACYVAKYIMGKRTGPYADYCRVTSDGEVVDMQPEFTNMSRRPGIGAAYVAKYGRSLLDHDTVVVNGKEVTPPRYYDILLSEVDADRMDELKLARREKALQIPVEENSSRRLWVREQVQIRKSALFKRDVT